MRLHRILPTLLVRGRLGGEGDFEGVYFTAAIAVSFGGTPATDIAINPDGTRIIASAGSGSSGNVTVTTPGGTAVKDGFTFIQAPTISSFSPDSGGSGTPVTINGNNFTGATVVSFGGTPATNFTVDTNSRITATVNGGSSGNVTVTTPGGSATMPELVSRHAILSGAWLIT